MIENLLAKNGDAIFDLDRKQLCSHHDPRGEAKIWAERRKAEGLFAENLIILGLGCGYHVIELKKQTSQKIYVIEANKLIIEACAKIHPLDFAEINARYINDIQALKESVWLEKALLDSYQVLIYKPSFFAQQEHYTAIYNWLVARNWQALTWLWEKRTQTHLIQHLQPVISHESNALTLKSIDGLIDKTQIKGKSKSYMILKALRELIT